VLLAQDGKVHDDVHRGDVTGDDDETRGVGARDKTLLDGALLDSLFALFYAAVDRLELGAWRKKGQYTQSYVGLCPTEK
jgi:hypothetical protein